jgi:hypothetical protein
LWFVVCVVVVVLHCDQRTMSRARSFARSNIPYPSHSLDKWAQFGHFVYETKVPTSKGCLRKPVMEAVGELPRDD